jgi:hypothetical protein
MQLLQFKMIFVVGTGGLRAVFKARQFHLQRLSLACRHAAFRVAFTFASH